MNPGAALLLLAALGCSAATSSARERRQVPPQRAATRAADRFTITEAIIEFATDLASLRLRDGNMVMSPFSIVSVLNMLLLGSTDNTYEQLRVVLKYPFEMDDLLIHQQSGIQLTSLRREARGINVQIANRIFTDSRFTIQERYMRDARDFYQAGVEQLEFGKQPAVAQRRINQWVGDNTNGKIPRLLDSPPPRNTRMIGANVVYFNSSWQFPFDPSLTRKLRFHPDAQRVTKTTMMFAQLEVPYVNYPSQGMKALALPYEGGDYAMYIMLPDEAGEKPLARMERSLAGGRLQRVFEDMQLVNISVWLPRFKLEHSLALRDALQAMGATDLFQESRAALNRMSPDRQLFLSEVLHQAVIDVHEAGTEAAAVTTTLVNRDRNAKEFRVDRPFLFIIRDNKTGVPLFWGRVVEPEAS
ncbi:serpin B3-like [Pollicipes pollicipes]|uniref:serpin B3-like n=1 Tax=Pollicipes pollicipes TaxID=41117 RepID=UPI0018854310|nr:serpin B3-like [Pollicipes pollicipes]